MFCKYCGKMLADNSDTCNECGKLLTDTQTGQNNFQTQNGVNGNSFMQSQRINQQQHVGQNQNTNQVQFAEQNNQQSYMGQNQAVKHQQYSAQNNFANQQPQMNQNPFYGQQQSGSQNNQQQVNFYGTNPVNNVSEPNVYSNEKKGGKKKFIIVAVFAVIAIVLAVVLFMVLGDDDKKSSNAKASSYEDVVNIAMEAMRDCDYEKYQTLYAEYNRDELLSEENFNRRYGELLDVSYEIGEAEEGDAERIADYEERLDGVDIEEVWCVQVECSIDFEDDEDDGDMTLTFIIYKEAETGDWYMYN